MSVAGPKALSFTRVCTAADLVMMFDDGDEVEMEGSSSFKESGGGEDGTDFLLVWTETTWARSTTHLVSL